jgi:hypothetical protein
MIIRKISAFLLAIAISASLFNLGASAEDAQYAQANATVFNGLSYELDFMVSNSVVYANALQMGLLFNYQCSVAKPSIILSDSGTLMAFSSESSAVGYANGVMPYSEFDAPAQSAINDQGAWIPFETFLFMADSGYVMAGSSIHIEAPRATVIETLQEIRRNGSSRYSFDPVSELGFSQPELGMSGKASRLADFFLDVDPASKGFAVAGRFADSAPYDSKYGAALAQMLVKASKEELSEAWDSESLPTEAIESLCEGSPCQESRLMRPRRLLIF